MAKRSIRVIMLVLSRLALKGLEKFGQLFAGRFPSLRVDVAVKGDDMDADSFSQLFLAPARLCQKAFSSFANIHSPNHSEVTKTCKEKKATLLF